MKKLKNLYVISFISWNIEQTILGFAHAVFAQSTTMVWTEFEVYALYAGWAIDTAQQRVEKDNEFVL